MSAPAREVIATVLLSWRQPMHAYVACDEILAALTAAGWTLAPPGSRVVPEGGVDAETTRFHLKVNGGEEQVFDYHSGVYVHAVMAAFGRLNLPYPCDIEIWCPDLVKAGYGPHRYRIDDFVDVYGNVYGAPAVMTGRALAEAKP